MDPDQQLYYDPDASRGSYATLLSVHLTRAQVYLLQGRP